MIVCAVGVHSQWGLILVELEPEEDETPLQQDLGDLATSMPVLSRISLCLWCSVYIIPPVQRLGGLVLFARLPSFYV